jgi:PAS domain S-box-containing protein
MRMRAALDGLRHPSDHAGPTLEHWGQQFDEALHFEESNITEAGEADIAGGLRRMWNANRVNLKVFARADFLPEYHKYEDLLNRLIEVNQVAMFRLAEESTRLRNRVLLTSGLIFLVTVLIALYLADGLAIKVAMPIKEIAEALKNKPIPGDKLRLPTPTSLEIRILTHEMNQLWRRLSELRKLNIEEIATQRNKLEVVLEAVEDAILVIDSSNNVLQCSEGLLKIIGLPHDLVVGHPWLDLPTADEDYLRLRELLMPQLAERETVELNVDAEKRIFACRCRKITNKIGETTAIVYLLHDITERKQRERLKSEFIAVLSHELKTPLQSLGTAAELMMKRRARMEAEERMLIETMDEDIARIRAVAEDFMQVSFVDPHSLKLKISKHAISELLQEWIKPFRVVARDRQVGIEYQQTGSEVIWANIDAVKFPWAISNLLSNAVRFSPAKSEVVVTLAERNEDLVIEIKDEGPGIPEDLRKKMFDPYFQAPVGESAIPSGFLGLGLTIAKEVVEAHQGRIEYHPGTPRGSVFRITLPKDYRATSPAVV